MAGNTQTQIDEAIYPKGKWIKVLDNNFQLDLTVFKCQNPIIPAIMKGHYLWPALHNAKPVPEIYLQQFWGHMHTDSLKDRSKIKTKLNGMRVILTPSTLRTTLALPIHDEYDALPSIPDLLKDVASLGYTSLLPQLSNFNGAYLRHPWKNLFGLVNKCLSPKHAGFDKCNKQILLIFHGIAFNKNYDMAQLFFSELMDLVKAKEKNRPGTIPYARWLGLIINDLMAEHSTIPKRSSDPHFKAPKLQYFKADKNPTYGLRIPGFLLNLVRSSNPAIQQYKEAIEKTVPMVQQNPAGPTQGTKPIVSKGPKRAQKPQKPVAGFPNEGKSDDSLETSQAAEGTEKDAEDTTNESSSEAQTNTDDEASESVGTESEKSDSDDDDDDNDSDDVELTYALIRKGKLPVESPKKRRITAEDAAPIIARRPQVFTIKETAKPRADPSETNCSKDDYDEAAHSIKTSINQEEVVIRETRAKVKNDKVAKTKPQPRAQKSLFDKADEHIFAGCDSFIQISRAESLSTGADLFGSRVEVAASGSTAHAQPSPSHSIASQKAIVSKERDSTPSLVPSESVEHTIDLSPEVKTLSSLTSSLGVTFPTFSSFSRTPTLFTAHTGALTLNATTRAQAMTVGSPATPIMIPSLNAGHTSAIFTDAVSTVTTLVTGHPTFEDVNVLLNRFLDSTIKPWVQDAMTALAQEFRTTQAVRSEQTPPQPSPEPFISHTQPISSTPLSHQSINQIPIPSISRGIQNTEPVFSPHPTTPSIDLSSLSFDTLASALLNNLLNTPEDDLTLHQQAILEALLSSHETKSTCKESLRGRKRSHEDPDDSDPHEGENKRPRSLEQTALPSQTPQPIQPETSTNQQPPSTAKLSSVVELEITSRGVSPRDTNRGGDGSPDDDTTGTSSPSGHQLEPSSKLMSTGNPSEPGSATQEQSPPKQRTPYISPGKDIHDALEEAVIYDKLARKWTEWDDLRVEAEQEDMQRNWWLRELINKCSEDIIRLEDDERKEGENYKESQKALESVVRQSAG
ncbi:unnamed protein product [Cuscuta europaea]|uniref:Uncharacterized protein n=1 Tax=Cuscuta europaea TaxID=41803 RepID=A0A9P1E3F7_CUSEU|nr:unnamed protein product [Cuscuta europaea]